MSEKTNWNESRSLCLSRVIVGVFFAALILCDIFGWWLVRFACEKLIAVNHGLGGAYVLLACHYICSVPAYVVLWDLHRLLKNIGADRVFVPENVRHLRRISWCCVAAALVCGAGAVIEWPSLVLITAAAGFMALIVRIVKNVFERAIVMKDELDLTV